MQRVNQLLLDGDFLKNLRKNEACEADRQYCRHDLTHALDVARIAYILSLEENLGVDRELIYAAALLHDIGRWMQYEAGIGHERASQALSGHLLEKHGFDEAETAAVLNAIGSHRGDPSGGSAELSELLYRADKLSRNCAVCDAIKTCKRFQNNETPYFQY
jgi:putative nucleotidyltransferase with HDIG domain